MEKGTYPYDVLACRRALENYFHSEDNGIEAFWALLKQEYAVRTREQDDALKPIAQLTLYIPARVFVYLTAELKKLKFWEMTEVRISNEAVPPVLNKAEVEWISLYVGRKPFQGGDNIQSNFIVDDKVDFDVHLYKLREIEGNPAIERMIQAYGQRETGRKIRSH